MKNRWLNKNVFGMGLASLFSDTGHEMATAILPMFLTSIGGSPAVLGIIEGIADASSSFVKLLSGWYSDRIGNRKPLVAMGYLITGVAKSTFALAHLWWHILIGRCVGWISRGFRGPIRDAMLADSVSKETYGHAFGFHRAMDTTGAVIGPLIAFLLVNAIGFRNVFLVTLIPGILSAMAIVLLVKDRHEKPQKAQGFLQSLKTVPSAFRLFLLGVFLFGIGDFAHTLLILRASQSLAQTYGTIAANRFAVLLYILHNVVYALASYPIGAWGDRVSKRSLLAGGYLLAAVMGVVLVFSVPTRWYFALVFVLAGVYIAAEDSLERSLAAELLPEAQRGTGYGMLATVNGIGDFASSIVVGLLWSAVSPAAGFGYAAVLSLLGAIVIYRVK